MARICGDKTVGEIWHNFEPRPETTQAWLRQRDNGLAGEICVGLCVMKVKKLCRGLGDEGLGMHYRPLLQCHT